MDVSNDGRVVASELMLMVGILRDINLNLERIAAAQERMAFYGSSLDAEQRKRAQWRSDEWMESRLR